MWNSNSTVKLDFKELLNKEQIEFKELFTDYQLFYTINLMLNKELLPIWEMPNLALRNTRSWKIVKKGDFRKFLDQFLDFILKRAPEINNQMKIDVETILSYCN